jgi:Protein of unknown function (DUF3592)
MLRRNDPIFWLKLFIDITSFALAGVAGLVVWRRKRSARHWPMTFGYIELALALDENNEWFTDLSYTYKVGTDFYSGRFRLRASNEEQADRQVLAWKGQNVTIRYSPKNPEISVLRDEDQSPRTELHNH